MNRRDFLQLTVSLALVSLGGRAGALGDATGIPGDKGKVLSGIVYQLFPHERLNKDVYEQVTEQLSGKIGDSAELTAMMDNALDVLAGNGNEQWPELTEQEKTAALEKIQQTPFFRFVLNETLGGIYRHPHTWELLGFEGSSLEFGGYINRGLDDIDWLPD